MGLQAERSCTLLSKTDIDTIRSFWVAFIAVVILFTCGFRLFFITSPVSFQLGVSRGNRSLEITLSLPPSAAALWLNARFPSARDVCVRSPGSRLPTVSFPSWPWYQLAFTCPKKQNPIPKLQRLCRCFYLKSDPTLLWRSGQTWGWEALLCKWWWTSSHGLLIRVCFWVSQWFLFGFSWSVAGLSDGRTCPPGWRGSPPRAPKSPWDEAGSQRCQMPFNSSWFVLK